MPSTIPTITSKIITKALKKPTRSQIALAPTPSIAQVSMPQKTTSTPQTITTHKSPQIAIQAPVSAPSVSTSIASTNSKISENFLKNRKISAVSSFGGALQK